MPVHNAEIAAAFDHLADLLEIEGANPFRVRAYRRAARTIEDLPRSAAELIASGEDLADLPGIGAEKSWGCCIELNAHPTRLDIDDHFCRLAKDMGVPISVGTDAHSIDGLQCMKYGMGQARRGWLEPKDVLNTRPLHELAKLFARR